MAKKNANDQNGLGCQVQFARDKSEKTDVTAAPAFATNWCNPAHGLIAEIIIH